MSTKESIADQTNYSFNQRPQTKGLYNADYEHDACGMGFISHMDGIPSRSIVDDGLVILERLVHVITSYSIHYTKLYEMVARSTVWKTGAGASWPTRSRSCTRPTMC